jgi:hypothetical protein
LQSHIQRWLKLNDVLLVYLPDSDMKINVAAIPCFEALCDIRHLLGISWEDMAHRVSIIELGFNDWDDVPMVVITVEDLMFNGIPGG